MSILKNIKTEWTYLSFLLPLLSKTNKLDKNLTLTVADLIEEQVDKNPNLIALEYEDKKYTYQQLDQEANKVANWAIDKGYKYGDVISLLMENKPEFLFAWIGLAKIGIITACLNSNIKGKSLSHCIGASKSASIIIGEECLDNFSSAEDVLDQKIDAFIYGDEVQGFENIKSDNYSRPDKKHRKDLINTDSLFYIYTSGTTGLPKASKFNHARFVAGASLQSMSLKMSTSDKTYMVLPLYHSTGGVVGVGATFLTGGTLVLRRKFSAENFWKDCVEKEITIITYIGEMLRYLVNTKESDFENRHKVRGIFGNGLRPDVWKVFEKRFNISNIIEFYGSSEGNISLINADSYFGSIGRIPPYLGSKMKTKIVKFNVEEEKVIRNSDGFCIECGPDETGEAIGFIPDDGKFAGRYDGYTNKEASKKKILENVFESGDHWFSSGDLLKRDSKGYFYFIDRIGDTFRWKSENVSTNEVSEVVSAIPGIKEANIYGVEVPAQDGRAGMASLVTDENFSISEFYQLLLDQLPKYSIPVFLRISPEIEITGTFKYKKTDLVKDGFDPNTISEELYFADVSTNQYIKLDADLFQKIHNQEVRV